ncbi:ASB14 [Symbiodinium sp. CCMP2592]|nr:ASB14 [Symbiodinium sp. CCMP2592]
MKTAKYRSPKGKPQVDPLTIDACDWVVVNGCGYNQGNGDWQLFLKKQVWLMRVCQRKTASTIASEFEDQGEQIDIETVEAYCSEVEVLRASQGMHWTWFQEELVAGRYDAQLSGEASGGHSLENVLLPPSADITPAANQSADASVGKVCRNRRSPNSSARSTPKMQSKLSPHSGPKSPQVERKAAIPQEVWMAAEKHRKSNFFGPALLHSSETSGALFVLLAFMEVSEVLSLALASAAFLASLLQQDSMEVDHPGLPKEKLWRLLGSRGTCPGFTNDSFVAFASDPAFRFHIWARQQRFFDRLLRGLTKTAVTLPSVQDLGGPGTTLGPFLPPSASSAGCTRLVVCDGKQTCRVVDVGRLREEQVEIDRYCSKRLLRSSVGAHPLAVTTSWPLNEVPHCCAAGGIVASRPAPGTGVLPRSSVTLQWLELPEFDGSFGLQRNDAGDEKVEAEASCFSPALKPRSPTLASAKTSPVLCRQKSPTMKAAASPVSAALQNDAVPTRTSVLQEQLLAALSDVCESAPGCLVVEGAWPLHGRQVLLTVREVIASSPSTGPLKSPSFRASTSPKGLLAEAMRGAPLAPLELPPQAAAAAAQLPKAEDQACQGVRRWLQVWDLAEAPCKEVALEPRACMAVGSQVTCIDTLKLPCANGGAAPLLLYGSRCGTVCLQSLEQVPESRASWAVEANFGTLVEVLLRPGSQKESATDVLVVVAQEHGLFLGHTDAAKRTPSVGTLTRALPDKEVAASLNVASLQPVGACGFAVCSPKHVYAFQALAGTAALVVVVELPGIPVRHFYATPYEFFAVLAGEGSHKRRTVCCLWPTVGESKATRACASAVNLYARVRGSETAELIETTAVAMDLSKVLLHGAGIDTMALNASSGQGSGLLAVSSVGSGISVFRWGMEVSPDLERIRELREECAAQQAHEHHLETLRRQLQRLQQRLQETERLEEKAQTKGNEALTEEEKAKIQRRGQVEADIERVTHELGMDTGSQEEDEADPQEERDQEIARHRREKERIQRRHHEDKRAMQKERRQNRERKFSE